MSKIKPQAHSSPGQNVLLYHLFAQESRKKGGLAALGFVRRNSKAGDAYSAVTLYLEHLGRPNKAESLAGGWGFIFD